MGWKWRRSGLVEMVPGEIVDGGGYDDARPFGSGGLLA
jgi:hypothetical protein